MNFKQNALQIVAAALLAVTAGAASATVVNFDDLEDGLVANGYGGITWGGNWQAYLDPQSPYNASSGEGRIYTNYASHPAGHMDATSFSFGSGVVFAGADVAGYGGQGGVAFELFYQGNLVHTSDTLNQSGTPTFLSSGYAGLVDTVAVYGSNGFYVLDDVTYNASAAVPEASNVAMMLAGLLVSAGLLRRTRKS